MQVIWQLEASTTVQAHGVLMPLGSEAAQRSLHQACCLFQIISWHLCLSFCLTASSAPIKLPCVLLPGPAQAAAPRHCFLHYRSYDYTACERRQTRISSWQGAAQGQLAFYCCKRIILCAWHAPCFTLVFLESSALWTLHSPSRWSHPHTPHASRSGLLP